MKRGRRVTAAPPGGVLDPGSRSDPLLQLRLTLFYVTSIGAVGCIPYLAVLLGDRGVPAAWASALLSVVPIALMIGGPLWGAAADRHGAAWILRLASWIAAFLGIVLLAAPGAWMAAALFPWMLARAPFGPLGDGLTVQTAGREAYGRIRAVGSGAFFAVAWLGGWLRGTWPSAPLWISAAFLLTNVAVSYGLPDGRVAREPAARGAARTLLSHPVIAPFLVFSALHGSVLVCFDNFLAVHVEKTLHLPSVWAGTGVGFAIAAEMSVMFLGRRWLPLIGPTGGLVASVCVGLPHWILSAIVTDPWAFVAVQALRGACFGAFWVGGVALLSEEAPEGLRGVAQALLPSTSYGVGYLLCSLLGTVILSRAGTNALFWTMAAVEVASLGLVALVVRASVRAARGGGSAPPGVLPG